MSWLKDLILGPPSGGLTPTPTFHRLVAGLPDDWPSDQFILVGSACLAVRGVRDVHDLDVLIDRSLLYSANTFVNTRSYVKDRPAARLQPYLDEDAPWSEYDFFTEPPRLTLYTIESIRERADTVFVQGRKVLVQSPYHTLAIKALVHPPRKKDIADMKLLAEIIADEYQSPAKDTGFYR